MKFQKRFLDVSGLALILQIYGLGLDPENAPYPAKSFETGKQVNNFISPKAEKVICPVDMDR